MNKKIFAAFVISLFLFPLVLNFVNSDPTSPTISGINPANTTIFGITPDSGVKLTQQWETWGKNWKTLLMENDFFKALDSFLQQISIVFSILFGMNYSLSLALLLTIALWLYFFFLFNRILSNSIFSKLVALLVSFGFTIILAQVGIFSKVVNFIIGIFFGEQPWWVKVITGVVLGTILAVIFIVMIAFSKKFAESKKKLKEEKNRLKLEAGAKAGEELSRAVTGKK